MYTVQVKRFALGDIDAISDITDFQTKICHLKDTVAKKEAENARLTELVNTNISLWRYYAQQAKQWEAMIRPHLEAQGCKIAFPLSQHVCHRSKCCEWYAFGSLASPQN